MCGGAGRDGIWFYCWNNKSCEWELNIGSNCWKQRLIQYQIKLCFNFQVLMIEGFVKLCWILLIIFKLVVQRKIDGATFMHVFLCLCWGLCCCALYFVYAMVWAQIWNLTSLLSLSWVIFMQFQLIFFIVKRLEYLNRRLSLFFKCITFVPWKLALLSTTMQGV